MPPANSKANYKTYEAQARMVRAIVAAHPEVKWNYKDMTEHALNHRFRRVRAAAQIIPLAREQGLDVKDLSTDENILPATQGGIDKNNIAKYFGQSTTDGIQFQFRTIKKDAEALRQTANDGGDVANCLSLGTGTPGTPSKPTPARSQPGSRSGKGAKRKVAVPVSSPIKRSLSEDEDEDFDTNYDAMDVTPSKRAKTTGRPARNPTPSRSAAVKAAATIADASAQMYSSESPPEEVATPTGPVMAAPVLAPPAAAPAPVAQTSIFGHVERKPQTSDFMTGPPHNLNMMNTPTAAFPDIFDSPDIFGTGHNDASYMDYGGDGEI
ncbi:hypothetical protein FALBO_7944 [Fusarium albosuccineum]|uniref:Uncharacterized protein n=1 Tax=Fusarium albosuccineum TaxID=1237068 RepID=A0A8H4LAF4_9HYPO|nr:hypothetical protein FALBO_7944 [Fusarium albosuccineum]